MANFKFNSFGNEKCIKNIIMFVDFFISILVSQIITTELYIVKVEMLWIMQNKPGKMSKQNESNE